MWLEAGSGRLVQEGYRKAAPIDSVATLPFLGQVTIDPREILIEYGLWEMQWWLPRVVAIEGFVRAGSAIVVPVRYERTYTSYEVTGTRAAAAVSSADDLPCARTDTTRFLPRRR